MVDMTSSGGPITTVREGMTVVDSDGETVGSVVDVRMSDTGVTTAEGQGAPGGHGVLGAIADAFGAGPDLPEPARERLVREGYLRVDAAGVFSGDRYVGADEIARVTGDTVHLTVRGHHLLG